MAVMISKLVGPSDPMLHGNDAQVPVPLVTELETKVRFGSGVSEMVTPVDVTAVLLFRTIIWYVMFEPAVTGGAGEVSFLLIERSAAGVPVIFNRRPLAGDPTGLKVAWYGVATAPVPMASAFDVTGGELESVSVAKPEKFHWKLVPTLCWITR